MMKKGAIVFRCDGAPDVGFGHVVRCVAVAEELRRYHCPCIFAMRKGIEGFAFVRRSGFQVTRLSGPFEQIVKRVGARAVVLDVRDDLPRIALRRLRTEGALIVTIDDPSDRRLDADLAFYPPIPQVKTMNWAGFTGKLFVGWEWVLLRKQFSMVTPILHHSGTPRVLITMGGSDPAGLTLKAVRALRSLKEPFEAVVLLGPSFLHEQELKKELALAGTRFGVMRNVSNVARLMRESDLAVASFGVTAYELAACGVPAVYLCLTPDHAMSASAFTREKMAISLGVHSHVSVMKLASAVGRLLRDAPRRQKMSTICRRRMDGRGTERIASATVEKLESMK